MGANGKKVVLVDPKPWKDWSDAELANDADKGMRGQGAIVEMTRRLRDSNNRLAKVNTWLVGVGAFVAILGVIVAILQLVKC